MATEDEIVKLVINAENLTSDELKEAANDVDRLGREASAANKELKKLQIDKANIESFEKLGREVNLLEQDLAKATVQYKNNAIELRKNKTATDEDRIAIERQRLALIEQRKVLNTNEAAFRKLTFQMKDISVTTKNTAARKEELNLAMLKVSATSQQLRINYKQQADALNESIIREREAINTINNKSAAYAKATATLEKQAAAKIKDAILDRDAKIEAERVVVALKQYEVAIEKLNNELRNGLITKGKYIKSEQQLRQELRLTEKQANVTRRAIEADVVVNTKRSKSTDLLTKATRRLAQAYTVIIAAQKATQAVGASVKGYGDLESAMTKVQKTTDLTRDKLQEVTDLLQKQAAEITPTATNELLRYAEVAGQLGVEGAPAILAIAEAADILQVSTNLAGDEAVTLLTRMLQMSGEGVPAIANISSAIVELGNNTAATESEIAHMAKEVLTGTASLNLGTAAAAGFAATLIESGQQAERSRGALFKLSDAIKTATVSGGEDLQRLADLTGLTADQIEENLGDRPEIVIQAFIAGLKRVKDEGGLISQTLDSFGVSGILANGVFEKLADSSDRLARNVDLSNAAFIDATAHAREASKAYANQESQVARLVNRFDILKTKVGEAFSDETFETIKFLDETLVNQQETVAELSNLFAEFGGFVVEVITDIEALADSIGLLEAGGVIITALRTGFNDLQIGINAITYALLEARIGWAKFFGASVEEIEKLEAAQDKAYSSMLGNIQDIDNAQKDFEGTSSATYRDLISSADKYASALGNLSSAQRLELEEAIKSGNFKENQNANYSRLTAAIIRAQREFELEAKLVAKATEARTQLTKTNEDAANKQNRLNDLLANFGTDIENYTSALSSLELQYESGTITLSKFIDETELLQLAVSTVHDNNQELVRSQQNISKTYGESTAVILDLTSKIREYTNSLDKLKEQQRTLTDGTLEYMEVTLQIQAAEEGRTRSNANLITIQELETKTLSELVIIQRQHQLVLDQLEQKRIAGTISLAEYTKAQEDLRFKTEILNEAIGDSTIKTQENTDSIDANTEAIEENTSAQSGNTGATGASAKAAENLGSHISIWALLQHQLNEELDYSSSTSEELTETVKELGEGYRFARQTVGQWWDDVIGMNNALIDKKISTIEATLAVRDYTDELNKGSVSLQQLATFASRADSLSKILGENQLRPLRDAIQSARNEFKALDDTINDSFDDVQDRLDALLGKEQDIVKRQFQREMDELLELLAQAKSSGDNKLIDKINEAIRKLKEAQNIEFSNQFGKDAKTGNPNQQGNQNNSGFSSGSKHTINVNFPSGQSISFNAASQSDADAAIAALSALGEINISGVN
jgi:TP901 family phage tail tape measure protein